MFKWSSVNPRRRQSPVCRLLAVLSVAFLLQSCGEQKLSPLPPDGVILAFGDSLTVGIGADKHSSYPSVLAELSGRRVVNGGVSGEVTAEGLRRLTALVEQERPAVMILIEGGNDILRNQDVAGTKKNLAAMIELAQGLGIEVVLVGVPAKSLFSDSAPLYRELAEQYGLAFEDELIANLLRNHRYKSDPIHFNAQGYRLMAEGIYELLVENGAL
ncbi:MAG: arylesterase [Pseudomonadales bacterium]